MMAVAPDTMDGLMEGWLYKKSPNLYVGNQRRWFSLHECKKQTRVISYYKEPGSLVKGTIPMSQVSGWQVNDKYLTLKAGDRTYDLSADSEATAKKWGDALNSAKLLLKHNNSALEKAQYQMEQVHARMHDNIDHLLENVEKGKHVAQKTYELKEDAREFRNHAKAAKLDVYFCGLCCCYDRQMKHRHAQDSHPRLPGPHHGPHSWLPIGHKHSHSETKPPEDLFKPTSPLEVCAEGVRAGARAVHHTFRASVDIAANATHHATHGLAAEPAAPA